jgi:hypothetical protein
MSSSKIPHFLNNRNPKFKDLEANNLSFEWVKHK